MRTRVSTFFTHDARQDLDSKVMMWGKLLVMTVNVITADASKLVKA